jgi:CheY-like chemotaxis protein
MVGEKILVVDDNQDFLVELNEILDCSGYCPTVVSDPMLAVNAARSLSPDVILLDLKMNGINGFQVAEQLKGSEETANIPIICMSGYFPVDKRSTLLDVGNMEVCIKKPFGVLELLKQIEKVLAVARGGKDMTAFGEQVGY